MNLPAIRLLTTSLLLASLVAGCKKKAGDDDAAAPDALVTVSAEHPEIGSISEHITADATLAPLAQSAISPKITAPVRTFYVQRGSHVKAGQLLAVLENRDLTAQALDNRGQLNAAQGTFDIQTKAQVPEDYAKAQHDVEQNKAQYELQKEITAARKNLLAQGAISGHDYDTAAAALAQAQANYQTSVNHLEALRKVDNDATKRVAGGQLTSAQGKLQAAEAQVSYSEIRSPISGVVTDRPLFPGETATSGTPLLTVMDTSSLLAKVHLAQAIAQRLSLGDEATLSIPGVDDPVKGKVTLISPAIDPGSSTVEVWIKLANPNGSFKAGTAVRVTVNGRTVPQAVKVPLNAVLTADDGSKSVLIIGSDSKAHKVAVQVGISDGDDIQITQGLNGSENVITQGAYGLSDGTRVKIGKPGADDGDDK